MKIKHLAAFTIAATAAFAALTGCGDSSAQKAAEYAATHPVITPAPAPTVTTTVNVPSVPQSCLDALDNADQGFTIAGQIMTAASQLDAATMNQLTDKLTELAPTYNANKTACREAGR